MIHPKHILRQNVCVAEQVWCGAKGVSFIPKMEFVVFRGCIRGVGYSN